MRAIAAGVSDVGRQRLHNEDRYMLLPEFNVFIVADGMGGHKSGEVASRMAASAVAGFFRDVGPRRKGSLGERLRLAVKEANARIFARSGGSRAHRGMGTTIVAAAFAPGEGTVYVAHAGDSRCYLVRRGNIRQLTRDHSLLEDALRERPDLTARDLAYLPRNVITRALGVSETVDVEIREEPVLPGDVFLLCSDGLHGLVADTELARIVGAQPVLTEACARLVELANERGGRDNITVVLVRIEEGDAGSGDAARGPSARKE